MPRAAFIIEIDQALGLIRAGVTSGRELADAMRRGVGVIVENPGSFLDEVALRPGELEQRCLSEFGSLERIQKRGEDVDRMAPDTAERLAPEPDANG